MKKIIAIFALAILLLITGCSSENSQSKDDVIQNENKQEQITQNEPKIEVDNELLAEFKEIIDTKSEIQYKVNYDFTTIAMNQTVSGKMAQYVKSTNSRTDYSMQGVETRTYLIDKELTSCSKITTSWNCMKIEYKQDEISSTESDFKENPNDYSIVRDGTKLVANVNAKCFKLTNPKEKVTARYCFSSDAVPLYVNMQAPGVSTEMTAMSYSKTLLPTDFDLPAKAGTVETGNAADPCMSCNYLTGDMKTQCLSAC